jgi:hypothetical protein
VHTVANIPTPFTRVNHHPFVELRSALHSVEPYARDIEIWEIVRTC